MMFRLAKEYMEEIGAEFVITGEVLNQRPMSQNKKALKIIENEVELEGKVLRPLSAKNLEPTKVEEKGIVDREKLLDIRGRSRKMQFKLAEDLGIIEYPNPAGGCLLTDPQFSKRVRDLFEHNDKPSLNDIELLKVGRHFRLNDAKLIVGRNKDENDKIEALALKDDILLEAKEYKGPVGLLRGEGDIELAASIVLRYSDAPRDKESIISINREKELLISPINDNIGKEYRI
jgi:tRNA U34 2-thiouridine synthase MnmA/TrmU